MLRFTPRREIQRELGVSHETSILASGTTRHKLVPVFQFIERIEKDPERRWLLAHPKVWIYARMKALAPTHGAPEIKKILERERQSLPNASRYWVPKEATIRIIVREFNLRPEGMREVWRKMGSRLKKTRPDNGLSEATRKRLVMHALGLISQKNLRIVHVYPQLEDYFQDRFELEARRIPHMEELSDAEQLVIWEKYVLRRLRSWSKDGLRTFGPRTRKGIERSPHTPIVEERVIDFRPAVNENEMTVILSRAERLLTKKQLIVLRGLLEGKTRNEIAREMGVGPTNIDLHVKKIRQKMG